MAQTAAPAVPAKVDRLNLQQGLLTAIAAGLSYSLADWFRFPGAYWAAISAIVVMQSEVGATVTASRDRLAGTAIGAVIGWLTVLIWHNSIAVFALAVLIVMVLCAALRFQNSGRLGGVTVAIVVLIPHVEAAWKIAVERFLEVSFGIAVSLAVALAWRRIESMVRTHPA